MNNDQIIDVGDVAMLITAVLDSIGVNPSQDIVFDPVVDKGNAGSTASAYQVEKDGVILDVSKGIIARSHDVWAYRIYKAQTMTISCENSDISKVVIECVANGTEQYGPGCFTASEGIYTYDENIGTWNGSSRSIVFTAATNQVRATKITVTIGEAGLLAPVISPASGTYYDPIDVTMTCSTIGAKIYYTTDGSKPTTSSTLYTAPFKLNYSATVKAISELNGEVSDVVGASYEFTTAVTVNNIREYQQVADNTVVKFANPVYVTAQSGNRLFVKDDTGYAFFYGNTGKTYTNGDKIPAGFVGTKITYDGEPELTTLTNFADASDNTPIAPEQITASQISKDRFAHYVIIKECEFDLDNMMITDDSGEGAVYFNMNVKKADVESGIECNVTGVIGSYGTDNIVYQLLPTLVKRTDEPDPDNTSLGELERIADNTHVRMVHDATVLWNAGSTTYVKDETGYGLIYGIIGPIAMGDIIKAPYTGTKTTYSTKPELTKPFGIQSPTSYVNVNPEVVTVPELGDSLWAHLVRINQVTFTVEGDYGTMTDADGNTFPIYTRTFGVTVPDDDNYHDVWGIIGAYKPKNGDLVLQLLPLSVNLEPTRPVPTDVANLQELYQLEKATEWGHFTTPLTAIYQNQEKGDLYVMDADGDYGFVYGLLTNTFKNGDIINDAIATWTTYKTNKQLTPNDTSFVVASHGTPVEPLYLPIEEISLNMVHNYFAFDKVEIISREENEKTNYYLIDENGDELMLIDKYEIGIRESLNCNVEAFLTTYIIENNKMFLVFYPIKITYNHYY